MVNLPRGERLSKVITASMLTRLTCSSDLGVSALSIFRCSAQENESILHRCSSYYMTETTLRRILYDHIYLRHFRPKPDYSAMSADQLNVLRNRYRAQPDRVFGVGCVHDGIWFAEG